MYRPTVPPAISKLVEFLRRAPGPGLAQIPERRSDGVRFSLSCERCGDYETPAILVDVDLDNQELRALCPNCPEVQSMPISPRTAAAALAAGAGLVVGKVDSKST